jgi:hypothetical protein
MTMSPNKTITDDKKEIIPKLCVSFSKRFVADVVNVSVDTVTKYAEGEKEKKI